MAIASIATGKCGSEQLSARPTKALNALACRGILVTMAGLSGCANRAYNDLYIENMAAEIRELEDQLYEYDHEYRLVEQELDAVMSENARLREKLGSVDKPTEAQNGFGLLEPRPSRRPVEPDPALPSIRERENGGASNSDPQSILEPDELPDPPTRSVQPGSRAAPPTTDSPFPGNELPFPGQIPSADDIDPDALVPPTITPGEIIPPQPAGDNSASTSGDKAGPTAGLSQLALSDSRIDIPAQLASRRVVDQQPDGTTTSSNSQQAIDQRVVELAFHSSLSRAANFDEEPDNDGLYLLLLPLNEHGQMVPVAADLSVVILDPARDKRIGRWDFSTDEIKAKLQPIGANQGIALTLPWSGPDPEADRVVVFVRYTFPNGRTVVNNTEILVSSDDGLQAVWAPRSPAAPPHQVPAMTSTAEQTSSAKVIQANHAAIQPGSKVVRPAAGTTSPQPAPLPSTAGSSPWSAR